MENLNTALLLMAVGMVTVFCILLIVIYLGKGLILLVLFCKITVCLFAIFLLADISCFEKRITDLVDFR